MAAGSHGFKQFSFFYFRLHACIENLHIRSRKKITAFLVPDSPVCVKKKQKNGEGHLGCGFSALDILSW
jgi:hypothetical protein